MKLVIFLALFITCEVRAAHPRDQWLDQNAVAADIKLAQRAYAHIHPGYTRYTNATTLNLAWQQIISQANDKGGMSLGDFYLHLSEILALIRCDHTKAELPKTLREARNSIPVYLPFLWQQVQGDVLVVAATAGSGLSRGDSVLTINGQDINQMINQVKKFVPVDGFTDHTKVNLIASSAEHMGGALDHFGALLWQPEGAATITYEKSDGTIHEQLIQRITYKEWILLQPTRVSNFVDAVNFKWASEETAVLKIDTFVNYRQPINPDKLYKPVFKQLDNTKRLVLDLRNNGGGSNEPPQRLLAHLMTQPFRSFKDVRVKTLDIDEFKPYISTWDKKALNPKTSHFTQNPDQTYSFKSSALSDLDWVKPARHVFSGQLIVLTSENNSSGSTNLLTTLKKRANTVFIGEETGGSVEGPTAGVLFYLKLPNSGVTTRIPVFRYFNDVDEFRTGKGLLPDVLVTSTKNDFSQQQDRILSEALKLKQ